MANDIMAETIKLVIESQITTKAVLLIFVALFYWREKFYYKNLKKELKLLSAKHSATNYALEKSFKNGYKEHYNEHLKQEMAEENYLK